MNAAEALTSLCGGQPQACSPQASQQFAPRHFGGTGGDCVRSQILGNVVMIALKATPRDSEALGKLV